MVRTMTLGDIYIYDGGRARVEFCWHGGRRDGYAWHIARQRRLASYHTRRETQAALERSQNSDGIYGCAVLHLHDED